MTKIKICGITNYQDASDAVMLGADFLGFNFYKESKRKISVKNAAEIIKKLPPVFVPVGIFVDDIIDNIALTVKKSGIKHVQLHGKETPEFCTELTAKLAGQDIKLIKAFRVKGQETLNQIELFKDVVDFFLLDSFVEGQAGGTGVSMEGNVSSEEIDAEVKPEVSGWDVAIEAKRYNKPIFLAGGLTPENVEEAIEKVLPFAVDVASGVERLQRRKDYEKVKKFITSSKAF